MLNRGKFILFLTINTRQNQWFFNNEITSKIDINFNSFINWFFLLLSPFNKLFSCERELYFI